MVMWFAHESYIHGHQEFNTRTMYLAGDQAAVSTHATSGDESHYSSLIHAPAMPVVMSSSDLLRLGVHLHLGIGLVKSYQTAVIIWPPRCQSQVSIVVWTAGNCKNTSGGRISVIIWYIQLMITWCVVSKYKGLAWVKLVSMGMAAGG